MKCRPGTTIGRVLGRATLALGQLDRDGTASHFFLPENEKSGG